MKQFAKFLCLLLVACMMLGVVACTDKNNKPEDRRYQQYIAVDHPDVWQRRCSYRYNSCQQKEKI